jgi:hypothetical protein
MPDANALVGSLSTFAAMMAGISVATERVVEIIKGTIPPLAVPWAKNDQVRAGILQLIAALTGAVIASQMPDQVNHAMPAGLVNQGHWQVYAVIGLMSSGGAGAWNHVLDILGAVKTKQESSAGVAQATPAKATPAAAG